jgi:hypothetical protein
MQACLFGFLVAFGPQLLNLSKAKKLLEAKSQKATIMSFWALAYGSCLDFGKSKS